MMTYVTRNVRRRRTEREETARPAVTAPGSPGAARHGLGAILRMYDENMRYVSSTYTPGWNRLKPGLRYVLLVEGKEPIVYEQGDIGFHFEVHNPWIPKEKHRRSFAWIKGTAGPASTQQVDKFTHAILNDLEDAGVRDKSLGVDFVDINMNRAFERERRGRARGERGATDGGFG